MGRLLDKIDSPKELKKLRSAELPELAQEIRELIVASVAKTGGHLASSLGAVELAIALHYVLDTPEDKVIWDVGHQAYAHKILTGRRDAFSTLRQLGGIGGFTKPSESEYDTTISGHSATSISSGLGIAAAMELKGEKHKVVCVIGDGSMTAGLAFEGLNQAGHLGKDLIVVLNDNEMSISENVGALSAFLSRKLTGRFAKKIKDEVESFASSIPKIGKGLATIIKKAEDSLIAFLTPGMIFEGLGFHYIGPIDGHDVEELLSTLNNMSGIKGPVLLHVLTKKGKGYRPAEKQPCLFHGIGPFDAASGEPVSKGGSSHPSYTEVFSRSIIEVAEKDNRIVAITAAMPGGTGLSSFAQKFPARFFDVGIAEQHAVTFASGLAREGFVPVVALYSTFMQRAYDQLFHDVCLEGLPVVLALDRAGIVGADGPTHHGLFDISLLRHLPGMTLCAPKDADELRNMMHSVVNYGGPVSIRYPRGSAGSEAGPGRPSIIEPGRAELIKEGGELTIVALGTMVEPAMNAVRNLEASGIACALINARFIKPLDGAMILEHAAISGRVLTVEENALQGGFGSAVLELFEENNLKVEVRRMGVPDSFVEQGTQAELRGALGLDGRGIERAARLMLDSENDHVIVAS
ncbi:1-deoxy-D-xylulose 5-phosphate synthase [hydrothermal vent metagenome]|uniref:1-deoxy-D-xylulose-5-phosphate synthase n=1 Tax=hydrothermal vent metagenome TaxID=652676 RepID=A0A3B0V2D4_9ZZZZ